MATEILDNKLRSTFRFHFMNFYTAVVLFRPVLFTFIIYIESNITAFRVCSGERKILQFALHKKFCTLRRSIFNRSSSFKNTVTLLCKFTYLLTPWSRTLLEKLTGFAASQEIPRIFGTRRFITILTSARHLSLS